jgi:hypothetical protein
VDFIEDDRRELLRETERVERVVHLRMRNKVVAEGHRHALEHDVRALLLDPCFEVRVEFVAVRAAVPEEFGDFDLARGHVDRLRRRQDRIVLARDGRSRRCLYGRADEAE